MRQTEADIIQNLRDAGCGEEMIQSFMASCGRGEKERALRLLSQQRKALLDAVHEGERKISCLDYLVYQMEHS